MHKPSFLFSLPPDIPFWPTMSTPASSATVSSADFHNLLAFMAACGPKCWLAGRRPGLDHLTKMSASRHAKVIKVLDALALICVRTTGDAFAVAAEIEHSSTTLTVAENNGCYDGTVAHLCRVWDILQRITHKLHQPHPLDSHKEAPPPVLKVPDELYNELCGAVYDHSFAKFNRRIKKARDVAVELGRLILPIRQGGSSEWDDLYDILVNINSVFNYCKNVEDPEFILCIFELSRTCQTFFNPMQRKVAKLAASFKKFDGMYVMALGFSRPPSICVCWCPGILSRPGTHTVNCPCLTKESRPFLRMTAFPFGRVWTELWTELVSSPDNYFSDQSGDPTSQISGRLGTRRGGTEC